MTDLLTVTNLGHLLVLVFLQAVLGFDNLLYISIESQRAPENRQHGVRFWGIIIAVVFRLVLLFVMVHLIEALQTPFIIFDLPGILEGGMNFATAVFLFGGVFIIYTAVREISHMLVIEHLAPTAENATRKPAGQVIVMIVVMNLVFSFDSILSAIAITKVFLVLATAVIISGGAMLLLADGVTAFLKKNRMYEVLGLFILLIVGVVLLGEAGPTAAHAMHDDSLQIKIFGHALLPMSKGTFYFSIAVLVAVEIIQTRYQRKLALMRGKNSAN